MLNWKLIFIGIDQQYIPKGKVVWNVRRKSIEEIKPMFYDIGIDSRKFLKLTRISSKNTFNC